MSGFGPSNHLNSDSRNTPTPTPSSSHHPPPSHPTPPPPASSTNHNNNHNNINNSSNNTNNSNGNSGSSSNSNNTNGRAQSSHQSNALQQQQQLHYQQQQQHPRQSSGQGPIHSQQLQHSQHRQLQVPHQHQLSPSNPPTPQPQSHSQHQVASQLPNRAHTPAQASSQNHNPNRLFDFYLNPQNQHHHHLQHSQSHHHQQQQPISLYNQSQFLTQPLNHHHPFDHSHQPQSSSHLAHSPPASRSLLAPFASSGSSNRTSSPILATRLNPLTNSHYLPPSPSPSTATVTNGHQPISSLAHSAIKRPRTTSPGDAFGHEHEKGSASKKRNKNPNHQTITKKGTIVGQLSTQIADETDPNVKPYGCGYLSCSGNSTLGSGPGTAAVRFNNCGELLAHWRAVHENARGNVERPFVCLMEGCMRDWKNISGIRYHIQTAPDHFITDPITKRRVKNMNPEKTTTHQAAAHHRRQNQNQSNMSNGLITTDIMIGGEGGMGTLACGNRKPSSNGSGSKPRSTWKKKPANNSKNEEKEAARKYKCPVPGCDKSYQQTSGLKYHLSNAPEHSQEIQRDKINLDALIAQSTLHMLKTREDNPGSDKSRSDSKSVSAALPPTPATTAGTSTSTSAAVLMEQPGHHNHHTSSGHLGGNTSNLDGIMSGPQSMLTHSSHHQQHHPSYSHPHVHQHHQRNPHEVFMMTNSMTTTGHTNGGGYRFD